MIFELLALLVVCSLAFILFGHLKTSYVGFIAGGALFALTMGIVAFDGVDVISQKTESTNYTAPFTWNYNTTYNFSTFTPSNTTKSTVYSYAETVPTYSRSGISLMSLFFIGMSLVGASYLIAGVILANRPPNLKYGDQSQ